MPKVTWDRTDPQGDPGLPDLLQHTVLVKAPSRQIQDLGQLCRGLGAWVELRASRTSACSS